MSRSPVIIIPARMAASRLPGKPLADIAGVPMIVQVWRRAMESGIGPVLVAADSPEIVAAVEAAGGKAVLTDPHHPSGSDRIFEAIEKFDPAGLHDIIVNVQGDLPTLDPAIIATALVPLEDPAVDISTLAAVITREDEKTASQVVKAVASPVECFQGKWTPVSAKETRPNEKGLSGARHRALYFTRASAPWGEGDLFHHIGLYVYRRAALKRFVSLPPSPLELREKLEQLRALEAGMRIDLMVVDTVPLGVDTPEDLERARASLAKK